MPVTIYVPVLSAPFLRAALFREDVQARIIQRINFRVGTALSSSHRGRLYSYYGQVTQSLIIVTATPKFNADEVQISGQDEV